MILSFFLEEKEIEGFLYLILICSRQQNQIELQSYTRENLSFFSQRQSLVCVSISSTQKIEKNFLKNPLIDAIIIYEHVDDREHRMATSLCWLTHTNRHLPMITEGDDYSPSSSLLRKNYSYSQGY